jgi:hypothetical protein
LSCYNLTRLGIVAAYQGNDAQATAFLKEVLSLCREQGFTHLFAECFEGLASSAALQGQSVRAARLFGAAEQLREVINAPRAPMEDQWHAKMTALAREALDPAAFEQAWADGRRMAVEEAIAYAMGGEEG